MAGDFLAGDLLALDVTFQDFMAGNFLAGDFLTRILSQYVRASQILEKSSYNMSAEGASELILEQSFRITCKYYNEISFFP